MRAYLMLSSLLALSSLGLLARPAYAQSTCTADSDCVKGWTCQVSGGAGCTAPACAPGETCDPGPVDCTTEVFKSCQPSACHADSDCADGLVCYTHTESNCAPTACAPGQPCPQPPPCPAQTVSACVPRYLLPCTTAADCGTGFKCESAGEQCACSGSAGGSADPANGTGGSSNQVPLPPPEDCTCTQSKEMRCHAEIVNCAGDSDCSAGWTCVTVATSGGCASAPGAPDTNPTPSSGAAGGATRTPAPDCVAPTEIKQCMPPYYGLIQGSRGVDLDVPSTPGSADQGDKSGAGNPGRGETTTGAPVAPSADDDGKDTTSSAGCSLAHAPRTSPLLAVFGALGLISVLRRRRAH